MFCYVNPQVNKSVGGGGKIMQKLWFGGAFPLALYRYVFGFLA